MFKVTVVTGLFHVDVIRVKANNNSDAESLIHDEMANRGKTLYRIKSCVEM